MKKTIFVLPFLIAMPMMSMAASYRNYSKSTTEIRPFVAYNIELGNTLSTKIKQDGETLYKETGFNFNSENKGSFVVGVEFGDIVALSLNPWFSNTKVESNDPAGNVNVRAMEIDLRTDVYLTRNSWFRPFLNFGVGYLNLNKEIKTSGAVFSFGVGCRQYLSDAIFVNANLNYNISTSMSVKEIAGTPVDNASISTSGFDLAVGIGYRF